MSKLKCFVPLFLFLSATALAASSTDRPRPNPVPSPDEPELVCNDMLLTMCMDAHCMGPGRGPRVELEAPASDCAQQCIDRYCHKSTPHPSPRPGVD